jgi:hypothetical protein
MIKEKINNNDAVLINKKLKKMSRHTLIFNVVVFGFIFLLFYATKNYLENLYILLLNLLIFGVWIYSCILSL